MAVLRNKKGFTRKRDWVQLKLSELTGIEKRKSQKNELSSQLAIVNEAKNVLEGKFNFL